MRRSVLLSFTLSVLVVGCSAQFRPCQFSDASSSGHKDGIAIWSVGLTEPGGNFSAQAFIPGSPEAVPGILFSHSAIHGPDTSADLTRYAWAFARAGAAVIVLEGAIEWQVPNDDHWRDPHVMACAGQWLLLHAKLNRHRLAVAGTMGRWGGGDTPLCQVGELPCWHHAFWMDFGQTTPSELYNTNGLLTREGVLRLAHHVQLHLKFRKVEPEWLDGIIKPTG